MTRFADIVGQDEVVRGLREAITNRRLPHSLAFTGPEGVGKRTTALALASRLFCSAPDDDACGDCAACREIEARTHPDLIRQTIAEERREISIDQVRELQAAFGRKPLSAAGKIAIIDESDALSEAAQNALLKTLEEPPPGAILILISRNPWRLRPTVRSRCQQLTFRPLSKAMIAEVLTARFAKSAEEAADLAGYGDGSLGRSLATDSTTLTASVRTVDEVLASLRRGSYREIPSGAEALLEIEKSGGGAIELLLRELWKGFRRAAGLELDRAGRARFERLTPREKTESLSGALAQLEAAVAASNDLERNANKALAIERMLERIASSKTSHHGRAEKR